MTNAAEPPNSSPLAPYRVLDLTEGGFNWCGKVLADLGADVIKVEPPEGSLTRRRGPFAVGVEDPEGSLFWAAYCLNKRSAALDLERADGVEALRELARGADVLVESFAPGYLAERGLGFHDLAAANPGLVYTSITPYGQTGPRAHHRAADIAAWAMGGMQYLCGDEDRPPVRVAVPQAELHAGAQAAAGTMIALRARNRSGAGASRRRQHAGFRHLDDAQRRALPQARRREPGARGRRPTRGQRPQPRPSSPAKTASSGPTPMGVGSAGTR